MVTSRWRFIDEVGLGDIVLIYLVINEIDKMILRRDVVIIYVVQTHFMATYWQI